MLLARQVSSLDLRLDIAGGTCNNVDEFDETFDDGVMPGTAEMMDITTTTLVEDAERRYGFSAFRGGSIDVEEEEIYEGHTDRDPDDRALQILDCPVFKECPGSGDPTHWCAWICGYWTEHPDKETENREENNFLRRVTEDLQIPVEELQPILYTTEDRELLISIEGLVCGWIQRWLDSRFSRCLNGAALLTCELELL